jgi:hypothetical protein
MKRLFSTLTVGVLSAVALLPAAVSAAAPTKFKVGPWLAQTLGAGSEGVLPGGSYAVCPGFMVGFVVGGFATNMKIGSSYAESLTANGKLLTSRRFTAHAKRTSFQFVSNASRDTVTSAQTVLFTVKSGGQTVGRSSTKLTLTPSTDPTCKF